MPQKSDGINVHCFKPWSLVIFCKEIHTTAIGTLQAGQLLSASMLPATCQPRTGLHFQHRARAGEKPLTRNLPRL